MAFLNVLSGMATKDCDSIATLFFSTRGKCMYEDRNSVLALLLTFMQAAEYLLPHSKSVGRGSQNKQNLVNSTVTERRVGGTVIIKSDG